METKLFFSKIDASDYPESFKQHLIKGYGEDLPFEDNTFDLVTTYQTLEHVDDVRKCLLELLRVLKPQGILYLRCPDYNCFFEPHYRVPFLPQMNKNLAYFYLNCVLKRPTKGLYTLKWTTRQKIIRVLQKSSLKVNIEDTYTDIISRKIVKNLPFSKSDSFFIKFLAQSYLKIKRVKKSIFKFGRKESQVDLWITKLE
ncbi:methyltransferase domain-containing protein [Synechocystis salina LEGE 06099]|uniref:class I SAM-dependent methyltransferase n=1 Tax=Synechocystis salina TaxID=945780 RepID=UPI001880BFE7|nr:class I SAM-dependent methyltransferase [Synechocystis salina]MBE9204804.1 methyltransferase domain-containing protein [Synechocystis salina LEGE 06099]